MTRNIMHATESSFIMLTKIAIFDNSIGNNEVSTYHYVIEQSVQVMMVQGYSALKYVIKVITSLSLNTQKMISIICFKKNISGISVFL